MALPYFLSARAYIYEHLISRALTSFFFFSPFSPRPPLPARQHSWILLVLAATPTRDARDAGPALSPWKSPGTAG